MAVAQDNARVGKLHLIGGADGLHIRAVLHDVRQLGGGAVAGEVTGGTVIQNDVLRRVGLLKGVHFRGAGRELVGGLAQRLSARGQAQLAVAVEAVVIGHRVHARLEEHGLELLAGLIALGQGIDGKRGDGVERSLEDGARVKDHLGLAVVLVDGAGDLDGFPNLWVEAGAAGVDEDGLGGLSRC